jgi:hypothetical protein
MVIFRELRKNKSFSVIKKSITLIDQHRCHKRRLFWNNSKSLSSFYAIVVSTELAPSGGNSYPVLENGRIRTWILLPCFLHAWLAAWQCLSRTSNDSLALGKSGLVQSYKKNSTSWIVLELLRCFGWFKRPLKQLLGQSFLKDQKVMRLHFFKRPLYLIQLRLSMAYSSIKQKSSAVNQNANKKHTFKSNSETTRCKDTY